MTTAKVLLDTNIVSYVMKGHDLARAYQKHLQGSLLSITFVTIGELYYGADKARWGDRKKRQLETTLRNFVVVPYDYEIARRYGGIVAQGERDGHPISFADAWIAACAVRHGIPIITHNPRHFQHIRDLRVVTELAS